MANGVVSLSNGVAQNLLEIGFNCWVRVGNSASDAECVGFVDSARGAKSMPTQKAHVIGSLRAASIDVQSYDVTLSLSGFIATPDVYSGTTTYNGGGSVSIHSFNPSSDDFQNGKVATKFPYIDFYDDKNEIILASFENAVSTGFNITLNAGTYCKADVSMEAIEMSSGDDYLSQ